MYLPSGIAWGARPKVRTWGGEASLSHAEGWTDTTLELLMGSIISLSPGKGRGCAMVSGLYEIKRSHQERCLPPTFGLSGCLGRKPVYEHSKIWLPAIGIPSLTLETRRKRRSSPVLDTSTINERAFGNVLCKYLSMSH